MGIFIGDTAPSKIFVGSSEVASVWAGDTQIRPMIKEGYIDLLVVGGGGNGIPGTRCGAGAGGGAGGFIEYMQYPISSECGNFNVKVGNGGGLCGLTGDSCFGDIIAYGGGGGCGGIGSGAGCVNGGSGSGQNISTSGYIPVTGPGTGVALQGNNGGNSFNQARPGCYTYGGGGGGGGGAGGAGCDATNSGGGNGGPGKCSSISGSNQWYAGGGGGGGQGWNVVCPGGCGGCGGGGNGGACGRLPGCNATYYGGGGGGGGCCQACGLGCQGVVILRYHTDGSDGILPTSTGGCKYTCGAYTIHCFTDTGVMCEFRPVYK